MNYQKGKIQRIQNSEKKGSENKNEHNQSL
jgi:hypothetical protein